MSDARGEERTRARARRVTFCEEELDQGHTQEAGAASHHKRPIVLWLAHRGRWASHELVQGT